MCADIEVSTTKRVGSARFSLDLLEICCRMRILPPTPYRVVVLTSSLRRWVIGNSIP